MTGRYVDMTNEAYHADRSSVSKTWLDKIDRSPAHLRHHLDGAHRKETAALKMGALTHSYILEDDVSRYMVTPKFGYQSARQKEEYIEYLANLDKTGLDALLDATQGKPKREDLDALLVSSLASQGKLCCDETEMNLAQKMREAVRSHPLASGLLATGKSEQTYFYTDNLSGVECKARIDWLCDDGCIVDLKTTIDARDFARSIAKYRYHVQAAHYIPAVDAIKFFFLVVEKTDPIGVMLYDADDLIVPGFRDRKKNLDLYSQCIEKDKWPCYPCGIKNASMPSWYFYQNEED